MKLCLLCGAWFDRDQLQQIEIDMLKHFVCQNCAKRALLIASQVKVPGWIAAVWQPPNLSQLALQHFRLTLDADQLANLCEAWRKQCLNDVCLQFNDFWRDFGIPAWLKHMEIIESGEVKKSP